MTKTKINISKKLLRDFVNLCSKQELQELIEYSLTASDMKEAICYVYDLQNIPTNNKLESFLNKRATLLEKLSKN